VCFYCNVSPSTRHCHRFFPCVCRRNRSCRAVALRGHDPVLTLHSCPSDSLFPLYITHGAEHCVGTTQLRIFGANAKLPHGAWCQHTHKTKQPTCALADYGCWGTMISPSFLTDCNFFTVSVSTGSPLVVLCLPVTGNLFCKLPPRAVSYGSWTITL